MYQFNVSHKLKKILKKIGKKNNLLYDRIIKKIDEIINCEDIEHYKNLRYDMKNSKRAHIGHFVLIFRFNENHNLIIFDDFDHHDKIYHR